MRNTEEELPSDTGLLCPITGSRLKIECLNPIPLPEEKYNDIKLSLDNINDMVNTFFENKL